MTTWPSKQSFLQTSFSKWKKICCNKELCHMTCYSVCGNTRSLRKTSLALWCSCSCTWIFATLRAQTRKVRWQVFVSHGSWKRQPHKMQTCSRFWLVLLQWNVIASPLNMSSWPSALHQCMRSLQFACITVFLTRPDEQTGKMVSVPKYLRVVFSYRSSTEVWRLSSVLLLKGRMWWNFGKCCWYWGKRCKKC